MTAVFLPEPSVAALRTRRHSKRIRVGAVPAQHDCEVLPTIARRSAIPVIADIHFNPRHVFAAVDAGCAGVPGDRDGR